MDSFDDLADRYDELLRDPLRDRFADGSEFFIRQKCRIVERRLARRAGGRPLRVLDVGCGQGTALACFGRQVRVFGADVSQPMLRAAVTRGPVTVQEPLRLPFADGTFDAAYAFCIYHHIREADRVTHLRELRRVVADGGEVMVFEHNPYNPVTARIFARAPIDRGCRMIAPAALRQTFRAAGFDTISQGYLLFVPQRLYSALGFLEPALSWLPLGGQYFVAGTRRAAGARDEISKD
jgi:SAM-dependent methyltransferase